MYLSREVGEAVLVEQGQAKGSWTLVVSACQLSEVSCAVQQEGLTSVWMASWEVQWDPGWC